jgi:hypothetical protein
MFQLKNYRCYAIIFMLATAAMHHTVVAEQFNCESLTPECCQFNSQLKLSELCVDKLSVTCAKLAQIEAHKACIDKVCSECICTDKLSVTGAFATNQFAANSLCASVISGANVYATNNLYANDYHTKYRATVVFNSNANYTLGSIVNFDTILDDPNNNITFAPTTYTAPKSGYYMVTLQIDQYNLVTAGPILGLPVGNAQILVNGIVYREGYTPYLSFFNNQKTTITGLISLKAGDKVNSVYKLLTIDQFAGVQDITGTVIVDGTGVEANNSIFKIHYLSSDGNFPTPPVCKTTPVDCTDCVCAPCCGVNDVR